MKVYKAPAWYPPSDFGGGDLVFLAGSIEMGKAEMWQDRVADALSDLEGVLLNPRRDDWDSSWEQVKTNPQFHQQVTWELDGMAAANCVFFYFDPDTQSPVTLLELGLALANPVDVIVVCPEGYFRKGNVDITCQSRGIMTLDSLEDGIEDLRAWIERGLC